MLNLEEMGSEKLDKLDSLVKTPICSSFYIMFLGVGVLEAYLLLQVVFYQRTLLAQGVFTDESTIIPPF
jgi:hypothetical protein